MRTVTIRIGEKEYPAALTVSAASVLIEKYGDTKTALEILQSKDPGKVMRESMDIVATLLAGGAVRERMLGGHPEEPPASVRDIVFPADLPKIRSAALAAMMAGLVREIEVEADRKNVETTQGE